MTLSISILLIGLVAWLMVSGSSSDIGEETGGSEVVQQAQEQADEEAEAAKKKAEALALALDSKIGRPLFIEEELIRYPVSGANFSNSITTEQGGAAAGNTSLAPGQIPITMQVRVSFLLVTDDN